MNKKLILPLLSTLAYGGNALAMCPISNPTCNVPQPEPPAGKTVSNAYALDYDLIGIMYQAPGNKSQVSYGNGSTFGTTYTATTNNTDAFLLALTTPAVNINASFSFSTVDSKAHAETKAATDTVSLVNTAGNDLIDHHFDTFVIQLGVVLHEVTVYDSTGKPTGQTQQINLSDANLASQPLFLNGTELIDPSQIGDPTIRAKVLQYLTPYDREEILLQNPFYTAPAAIITPLPISLNGGITTTPPPEDPSKVLSFIIVDADGSKTTLDPKRFIAQEVRDVLGPPAPGVPGVTQQYNITHTVTDTDSHGMGEGASVSVMVGGGVDFFGQGSSVHAGVSVTVSHTDTTANNTGTTQSASTTVGSSTPCFHLGAQIFYDKAFATFAFKTTTVNLTCMLPQVSGHVVDQYGNGVPGAQVTVYDPAGVAHIAITDETGVYELYSFSSLSGGFRVAVNGGGSTTVNGTGAPISVAALTKLAPIVIRPGFPSSAR